MHKRARSVSMAVLPLTLIIGLGAGLPGIARAEVCVGDDAGHELCLEAPAKRIVALSPGVTELLFAAGAGERVVGAVSFSDYPVAAQALPRVGSYDRLDLEALLALEPDLVVAWQGGNPREQVERLSRLGLPVYFSDVEDFAGVAGTLERFGTLAGTPEVGATTAASLREEVATLRERYANAAPVPVFYQVWEQPLMTINGEHWISRSLELCGGVNLFADESTLAPRIGVESVLARDPEAIITGGMGKPDSTWLEAWRDFPQLTAVQRDNLFFVDPDLVQRATPRLVEGTRQLCQRLEVARGRR
ncbi:iron complex transport system substrate-binding protein [Onishia taeanensis]|uniref:Iron complex transport system substrate-binding protein n=1 Tax=Onishia taeanensis TaxID=284577 RepID=A0A1G7RGT7_9GAMM|nr:cobalamin-binding protein [Halomonas taeanensis]SDG10046.1 iron complex transport system substrate-binding protein [Halomonas taeanensis]